MVQTMGGSHPKVFLNPLMHGGNKRSFILEQTCCIKLQVCSSIYDLLLPPCIKGLKLVFLATSQNSWEKFICNFIVKLPAYKYVATLVNIDSFSTIYHGFC